jgi:hypothetical protein
LRAFENRVLRKIFRSKRDEVTGEWRKLHKEELHHVYSSPNIIRVYHMKKNEMGGSYSIYGGKERCIQGFGEELEGNRPLERIRPTWEDNIKIDLQELGWWGGAWIGLLWPRIGVMSLRVP